MTQDELVGAAEAARMLGLGRSQLARLARKGTLPPVAKLDGKTGAYFFGRATVLALKARRDEADETRAAS